MPSLAATVLPFLVAVQSAAVPQSRERELATAEAARAVLWSAVESGEVAGAIGLVAEEGSIVFLEAAGEAAPEVELGTDAIMRTASIGKAVTAAATLLLVERGKLRLDQSVADLIPAFAHTRVSTGADPEPLERPIQVRDLLTHQAGFAGGGREVDALWEAPDVRVFSERLAAVPLRFQPGHGYEYGPSYEVLAAVIELASGERFDRFLKASLFDALKMHDTYFSVPPEKLPRLAAVYERSPSGTLAVHRGRGQEEAPSSFFSGGGALRTTVADFWRFAQMLLNGGELDGVRVLSIESVRAMMTDQVGAKGTWTGDWGWGYGGSVRRAVTDATPGGVGSFSWSGGTGSKFLIDPSCRRITISFTQMRPPARGLTFREEFERAAYGRT